MVAVLAGALLIVAASLVIGRATMALFGWRRFEWLAGAVGFAALITLAPFLIRLPGRGLTTAVLLLLITLASAIVARRSATDSHAGTPVAVIAVAATLALASLPFLFNERTGVLGEGIYTNDQAAQLYWADWLADGFGPRPNAVQVGYPVGPQALAASVSEGTTIDLVAAFNGMLLAIPALTALAALCLLGGLPAGRRVLAAALTGLPYLGASFLAQSGFKETAMALLVVAMAITLHLATRRAGEEREPPPARAVVAVLAVLAAGAVFTFSLPGLVWFAATIPAWAILWLGFSSRIEWPAVRAAAGRHRRALFLGGVALAALGLLVIGPSSDFVERIDDVQESRGRLSSPVFPGEALGIWPEGDFRIVRGEVGGALLASGFAGLCALGAALALVRRREWALLSTLGAAAFVYVLSRPVAQIHVEAKALAVLAPIVMLLTLRWLLAPAGPARAARLRLAVGGLFAALALGSTFLALRAAPVGFDERQRDLEVLASHVGPGEDLVFLGVDRFAGYYLRGTLARSPGGYVPAEIRARTSKTWQQGEALDFDTLEPRRLNHQEFVITTAAAYQSSPHPNFSEVARQGDYVLWERRGDGREYEVLPDEGGDPGARYSCTDDRRGPGRAVVLDDPVVGRQAEWSPGFTLLAPAEAEVTLGPGAGEWALSLQYHSQAPLTVTVDGEEVADLLPSLEGFYLVGAGRGAYWPAGTVRTEGEPVEVRVEAARPGWLQRVLGVERRVWLGEVALTPITPARAESLADACGSYVDRYAAGG